LPFYEFKAKNGRRKVVHAPISGLPALVEEMKADGWMRLYSLPNIVVYPGYSEAMEEAVRDEAVEEKKMATDRAEAARDVDQAVREELGTP
jgi:hypothetical protein